MGGTSKQGREEEEGVARVAILQGLVRGRASEVRPLRHDRVVQERRYYRHDQAPDASSWWRQGGCFHKLPDARGADDEVHPTGESSLVEKLPKVLCASSLLFELYGLIKLISCSIGLPLQASNVSESRPAAVNFEYRARFTKGFCLASVQQQLLSVDTHISLSAAKALLARTQVLLRTGSVWLASRRSIICSNLVVCNE